VEAGSLVGLDDWVDGSLLISELAQSSTTVGKFSSAKVCSLLHILSGGLG
jgi:hypothetical protein